MAHEDPLPDGEPDATVDLLMRARDGDRQALETLFGRHTGLLRSWASGRLPQWARSAMDTVDLVQETMVGTLRNLDSFEPRGEGALQAYLRQALINRIRSQVRNAGVRPTAVELDSAVPDDVTSPLEAAIGQQTLERYEAGLRGLAPDVRTAVISRVELGLSYAEIAELLGKPSADAARMTVARALITLAEEMDKPA